MKILVIKNCFMCPYSKTAGANEGIGLFCTNIEDHYALILSNNIPDWCPLEDYKEDING